VRSLHALVTLRRLWRWALRAVSARGQAAWRQPASHAPPGQRTGLVLASAVDDIPPRGCHGVHRAV